jgi:hypothetical protein
MMRDREKVKLLVDTLETIRSWIDSMSFTYNFGAEQAFKAIDETLTKVKPK